MPAISMNWFSYQLRDILRTCNAAVTGRITPLSRAPVKPDPIFIIGCGRSGNTLLRKLLVDAGIVAIPPETYALRSLIKDFRANAHRKWSRLVRQTLSHLSFEQEFAPTFGYSLEPVYRSLLTLDPDLRCLASILDAFYRDWATRNGLTISRWGDKTPLNTFAIRELRTVFPNAKFIEMRRDPIDTVASYMASGLIPDCKAAALRWKKSVDAVEAEFPSRSSCERLLRVQYEDLVATPEASLATIIGFIDPDLKQIPLPRETTKFALGDVESRQHHDNVLKPISTSSIGKGRRALSHEEVNLVLKITKFQNHIQ